jgi:fibronectin type 3 domain-containing protein
MAPFLVFLAFSCGVKARPVPMDSIVPRRIVDLRGVPREGGLLLEWTAPKENTDKSPLTNLVGFQILRSEGVLVGEECQGCGGEPKLVHEIKLDEKEPVRDRRMLVFFEDLEARKVYIYQVVSLGQKGYPSAPSNPVQVYWDYPPQKPTEIRGERGDKRVDLSWSPVPGASGYNVYRRGEDEPYPWSPMNREPLTETQYTDLNVQNERKYFYSIRAVKKVAKTDVEGKGSPEIPETPTDLIPPRSPVGLVAVPLRDGVEVNWRRNEEADLLGYNIYRRKSGERDYKKLNPDPWAKETYLDKEVELGQEYDYVITAVDNAPHRNESPFSEAVRVKYLY